MRTILVVLAFLFVLPLAAEAQPARRFMQQVRRSDPDTTLVITAQQLTDSDVLYIYVTDNWYTLACFQRQRLAKGLRDQWRAIVGRSGNVVLFDRAETEVADFQIFGGDFDVRGCG